MRRYFLAGALAGALSGSWLCGAAVHAGPRVEHDGLVADNLPETPAALAARAADYAAAREATPLGWTPKGRLLIATAFADTAQVHVLDGPGSARRQLTFLPDAVAEVAVSADPAREAFVFTRDSNGDGRYDLYYQVVGAADARRLSDGRSTNGAPVWSNSGREIAFFTTARDGKSQDIDIVDIADGSLPHLAVAADAAAWSPLDWSPDDRKLLALRAVSSRQSSLVLVDLDDGGRRDLSAGEPPGAVTLARFARDGQGAYYVTNQGSEFKQLRFVNFFTGQKTVISSHVPWDVEELAVSRDGHYLAYVSKEGGNGRLNLVDLRAHQDLNPPHLPGVDVIRAIAFDADSKRLAVGVATPTAPRDAYVLDIESNRLEAWTHSEAGAVDSASFVGARADRFPTFDRDGSHARELPLYAFEPMSAGPHPVLIWLHGGVDSEFRPSFDPWIQFVVKELGFTVLAPNLRGSSGLGKTIAALADGRSREDAVKDIGALLVWIGLQGSLDAKRVVIGGVGYGGYLAAASLETYGDRLRAGIDLCGISDFVDLVGDANSNLQPERRAQFGDERDTEVRAYLRRISPLTNADRLTKPLLVVHGKNDPWVPVEQSDSLVSRLESRGAPVAYLVATREGHVFTRQSDRAAWFSATAGFLATLR